MRELLFSIVLMGSIFTSIKAQNIDMESTSIIEKDTLKKSEKKAIRTTFMHNRVKDNWFFSISGGAAMLRGEDSPNLDFKDRISPTVGFSVGKWISPVWGIRLNVTGSKLKSFSYWDEKGRGEWYIGMRGNKALGLSTMKENDTHLSLRLITDDAQREAARKFIEENFLNMDDPKKGGYTYDIPYIGGSLDLLLSLTNLFSLYDPHRFFNLNMFGGVGFTHTLKKGNRTAVNNIMQKYGLQGSFRLNDQFSIDLEPQLLIVPEIFDYHVGDGNTMDGVFNLMIGVTYKFKDRHFYEPRAVCNDKELNEEINRLRALLVAQPVDYKVIPTFAYIIPQVETKKERAEIGTAYLDFPVGKYQILKDYRRNTSELEKINQTIQSVTNDKDIALSGIYLKGFASPEGSYTSNKTLAENRVKALRDYIISGYSFKPDIFTLDAEPEDWKGFKDKVENGPRIPSQNEVLAIIDSHDDPDRKEQKLRALDRGVPFSYALNEIFPSLRRTEYRIDYSVRGFSLEESREIIRTRPQHLSLNEMFAVANSYPVGSEAYNEVFEIAVRLYSSDPVANLNAANIAMSKGDLISARNYLAKAGNSAEAIHASGILNLLDGNLDEAQRLLEQAKAAGIKEAGTNLQELQKKKTPAEEL